MKVVIFNVGPALSAYIEFGDKKVVYDLGKSDDFSPVRDFLIPLFKKREGDKDYYDIDQLFLSHPHRDHISDLEAMNAKFHYSLYTTPNDLSDDEEKYKNVNWSLVDDPDSDEVKRVKDAYKGRCLPLRSSDPSRMTIGYIYPGWVENDDALKNESYTNNISIVLYIHSGYRLFFAADIQKEGMIKLLNSNQLLKKKISQGVDFLVCPHHGLRSSFSKELFEAMKDGKTKKLNIVSEKQNDDDNRNVDSRYASSDYCEGDNNLSSSGNIVCQRKTSQGHIFIDDDGSITVETDINKIIEKF